MNMKSGSDLLTEVKARINEIDIHQLKASLDKGENLLLVDVRERDEWDQGKIKGAQHITRGMLEFQIENLTTNRQQPIALICAGGARSAFAAESLEAMGFHNVASVSGGFGAWKNAGYPFEMPRAMSDEQRARYARHTVMPEIGEEGQLKLLDAKVLIVGAGGLGSPAALYLAAAGVGTIGLIDFDTVDASNLQRQIIHRLDTVGQSKIDSARETIAQLNPDVEVVGYPVQITSENALDIIKDYDVVLNGSDNFPTRYLVNDACVLLGKPLVDASIFRFDGQVTVFDDANGGPNYRSLYPDPPPPGEVPSCAEGGVMGVLPGIIGSLQAVEAIKLILGLGNPLVGRVLQYDALEGEFREFRISKDPNQPEITELIDYEQFCGVPAFEPSEPGEVATLLQAEPA